MNAAPRRAERAGALAAAEGSPGSCFEVLFAPEAEQDLERLYDALLDSATTLDALRHADAAMQAIRSAVLGRLSTTPYVFRKAGASPTRRELIVPFGATGYVALYEIAHASRVLVLAVRHQREDDYH